MITQGTKLAFVIAAWGGLALVATGCGSSPSSLVTGASISSQTLNGDLYVTGQVDFNTSSITLPDIDVPFSIDGISNAGSISMSGSGSVGALAITADVTQALKVQGSTSALLPNGTAVPVAGLGDNVIEIQISSTASVYLALSAATNGSISGMIGAAVNIASFNSIGTSLGSVNIFPSFTFGSVEGAAGIYTGSAADTSGLAIFLDTGTLASAAPAASAMQADVQQSSSSSSSSSELKFGSSWNAQDQQEMENQLSEKHGLVKVVE